MFDLRVFQDFARRQSVAAAEDEDAGGVLNHLHGGQDEGFVVTGFVARGELQVAVDVEAGVVFPAGYDEPLVGRVALIDDRIAEIALFGFEGDAVGVGEGGGEDGQANQRAQADWRGSGAVRL